MKISTYHSYYALPLFLNAELVAKVLGVSISSAYELMHEEVFPSVRIGSRFVVPKDKFQQWVERQTGGAR
ncbi:helix-turn-helix transcriptional regulator [Dysosmobacter sp.]|uniref:helix-turn-helix transcriptional regulator n=1 Tax=Dysosmobacter sp. TaxID=2591382 RepID=UPI003AF09E98